MTFVSREAAAGLARRPHPGGDPRRPAGGRRGACSSTHDSQVMLCGNPDMLKDAQARSPSAACASTGAAVPGQISGGELLVAL